MNTWILEYLNTWVFLNFDVGSSILLEFLLCNIVRVGFLLNIFCIYLLKFIFFNHLDQSEVGYKMTWPIAAHHIVHMVKFLTFPFPLWFIYLNLYFFNSLDQSEVGYKMTWPIAAHHMVHMVQFFIFPFPLWFPFQYLVAKFVSQLKLAEGK